MTRARREFLMRYRPVRARLALLLAAGLFPSVLGVAYIVILRRIFDEILPAGDLGALNLWGALLLCLPVVGLLVALPTRRGLLQLTKAVTLELRRDLVLRLYELPRSFYTRADLGTLHARLVYESERVDTMSNTFFSQFVPSLVTSAVLTLVMLTLQWRLALLLMVVGPLFFLVNRALKRRIEGRYASVRAAFEAMSRGLLFVVHSVDLTRTQTAEPFEVERQTENFQRQREASTSLAWLEAFYGQVHGFLTLLITVLILLVGGRAVAEQRMTLGALMAFFLAATQMSVQLRNVFGAVPQLLIGMKAVDVLAQVLDHPEREPYSGDRPLPRLGTVRVEGVHFRYHPDRPLLEGFDLEIRPGQRVALLGPNGCGKSTLLYLLAGFYRPEQGRLTAGGLPYADLRMADLRRRMAFVPQHAVLFNGTVRENIAYGLPGATPEAIERAAQWAMADEFICSLPDGYESRVGDQGVRLSGGQRQRIALARALLREPELLVLDEPTNHLDAEAVGALMHQIGSLPYRPAVLVISHERRVLRHVDEAWRLDAGRAQRLALTEEAPGAPGDPEVAVEVRPC